MDFQDLVREARQHSSAFPEHRRARWAAGQQPVALFIACSDSRVVPSLITGVEPGTLFELRTAGTVVPPYTPDSGSSEMATIEYAVLQLEVGEIVVCGHSHCGAVTALVRAGRGLTHLPALRSWLGTDPLTGSEPEDPAVRTESKRHVVEQLRTLREYPFVRQRVDDGRLRIHGWFLEIDTGRILRCTGDSETDFVPL